MSTKQTKSDSTESKGAKPKPRFGTLNDLQNSDSSSEEEEGQAFYAGGSEHSGQQVLGPGKKKKDLISDMFKSCQEQSIAADPPKIGGQQRPNTFRGTGYKLGQTSSDSEGTFKHTLLFVRNRRKIDNVYILTFCNDSSNWSKRRSTIFERSYHIKIVEGWIYNK